MTRLDTPQVPPTRPPEAASTFPPHGGDLTAAIARFGRSAAGWLDLSTGINPFAYPLPEMPREVWQRLPDAAADARLRDVAATAWGIADPSGIVSAPGAQSLIQLLPRLRPRSTVAIVGPTYPGYATAFAQAGHAVMRCTALADIGEARVAVLVNPNNPDGRRTAPADLRTAAAALAARDGLLIVDESFVDTVPELSVAGGLSPGLLVLRSFGKFFGLAGTRLGFAVGPPDIARQLRDALGPWPVAGPTLEIGRIAMSDRNWIDQMRGQLAEQAAALDAILSDAGLAILGGTTLFRLACVSHAWSLYEHLGRTGILVRAFAEHPRWLRFGLPPDAAARERLAAALAAWRD